MVTGPGHQLLGHKLVNSIGHSCSATWSIGHRDDQLTKWLVTWPKHFVSIGHMWPCYSLPNQNCKFNVFWLDQVLKILEFNRFSLTELNDHLKKNPAAGQNLIDGLFLVNFLTILTSFLPLDFFFFFQWCYPISFFCHFQKNHPFSMILSYFIFLSFP